MRNSKIRKLRATKVWSLHVDWRGTLGKPYLHIEVSKLTTEITNKRERVASVIESEIFFTKRDRHSPPCTPRSHSFLTLGVLHAGILFVYIVEKLISLPTVTRALAGWGGGGERKTTLRLEHSSACLYVNSINSESMGLYVLLLFRGMQTPRLHGEEAYDARKTALVSLWKIRLPRRVLPEVVPWPCVIFLPVEDASSAVVLFIFVGPEGNVPFLSNVPLKYRVYSARVCAMLAPLYGYYAV